MQVWDSSPSTQHGRSLRGYEAMNMIRKGQIKGVVQGDSVGQAKFIADIFGVTA